MSLLSSLKNVGTKLKNTFLPSEEVSAKRRKDVFGTESKAVAGAAIVTTAAAAIIAPSAIKNAGGIGSVISKVGSAVSKMSLPKQIVLGAGTAIASGAIVANPKTITKTTGGILNTAGNLYEFGKSPSIENLKNIYTENPILATGASLVAASGVGVAGAVLTTKAIQEITEGDKVIKEKIIENVPDTDKSTKDLVKSKDVEKVIDTSKDVPITPEIQILGKSAKSGISKTSRKKAKKGAIPNIINRIQIVNFPKTLYSRNRIGHI